MTTEPTEQRAQSGRRRRATVPSEHAEQKALFAWWRVQYKALEPYLIAIPNGGARNLVTGAMLKAEGVRRGVPDVFLAYPSGGYHGLWIEMKRRAHGYASAEQKLMLAAFRRVGYDAAVCRGWDEAREKIQSYLGAKARGNGSDV